MFSSLRLKLSIIAYYEKKIFFFTKIILLQKHSKILPLENSGDF